MIGRIIQPITNVGDLIDFIIGLTFIHLINLVLVVLSVLAMLYWMGISKKLYKRDRKETRGWMWLYVSVFGIVLFNISSIYTVFTSNPMYEMIDIIGRTLIIFAMTIGAYLVYTPLRAGAYYRLVPITPKTEKEAGTRSTITELIKRGQSYLIDEEKPLKSNEIFVKLVTHGVQGLYITRKYPKEIRDTYNLVVTPMIWLTNEKTEENHIYPTDLVELSHTIKEFIKKTNDGVVLVDGLEYLITQNNYDEMLKFIQAINDSIAASSSRLIIPVDHSTLTEQQFHLLKRDMKFLETDSAGVISMLGN